MDKLDSNQIDKAARASWWEQAQVQFAPEIADLLREARLDELDRISRGSGGGNWRRLIEQRRAKLKEQGEK